MKKDTNYVNRRIKRFIEKIEDLKNDVNSGDEFTQLMAFDIIIHLDDQINNFIDERRIHLTMASGLVHLAQEGSKEAKSWLNAPHHFYTEVDDNENDNFCACECGESHDGVGSSLKDQFKKMDESFIAFMESIKPR